MTIDTHTALTLGRLGFTYKPNVRAMLCDFEGASREALDKGPRISSPPRKNIDYLQDVARLNPEGMVVDGDLKDLLSRRHFAEESGIDSLVLAQDIATAATCEDSFVVLSNKYRVSGSRDAPRNRSVQLAVAHNPNTRVWIDSLAVKRKIISGRYTGVDGFTPEEIKRYRMNSETVFRAAFEVFSQQGQADDLQTGVSWQRPDGAGVMSYSLGEAIQATLELVARSDTAFYGRILPRLPKGYDKERFTRHRDVRGIDPSMLEMLQLDSKDHIKVKSRRPFHAGRGWHLQVPTRTGNRDAKGRLLVHDIDLANMPVYRGEDSFLDALVDVWNISAIDRGAKSRQGYISSRLRDRSGRRDVQNNQSYSPHGMAAAGIALRLHKEANSRYVGSTRSSQGYTMHTLPFVIPRKKMVDIWNVLQEKTVMIDYDDQGVAVLRKPNLTEKENLLWNQVKIHYSNKGQDPRDELFTTDPSKLTLADVRSYTQVR